MHVSAKFSFFFPYGLVSFDSNFVLQLPWLFSFGTVSKDGPTREQVGLVKEHKSDPIEPAVEDFPLMDVFGFDSKI